MNIAKIKLKDFIKLIPLLEKSDIEQFSSIKAPNNVCNKVVPASLDHITMGQLISLQSITINDALFSPAKIVLNCNENDILKEPTSIVLGFNNFVSNEIKRIAELFEKIPNTITSSMKRAGVDKLNFGVFGMIDCYARRMGIIDHDYVLDCVGWLTIYQCIKNDAEMTLYEQKLRELTLERR